MSQYLDLLLDKPRRFKLTPTDWRDAARRLSILMGSPISTTRLVLLVGEMDDNAIACTLVAGCRHEDGRVSPDKILSALDARREAGQDTEDIGEAILSELRRIGVLRRQVDDNGDADDPNAPSPTASSTLSDGSPTPGPLPSSSSA